jgi:hypothetical protein
MALIVAVFGVLIYFQSNPKTALPFSPTNALRPVGYLPILPNRPQPKEITFNDCPPEGVGGDAELNLLKNRVDEGVYIPMSFDTILNLTWPKNVEQTNLKDWSTDGRAFIAQYAGIPVVMEGYFGASMEAVPNSANCNLASPADRDWNIYFTEYDRSEHSQAIIVTITPRVRAKHIWNLDLMRKLIMDNHVPVRVSGWLLFNPQNPEDVGKTRATLWEIHPVMQIELYQNGHWVQLDKAGD